MIPSIHKPTTPNFKINTGDFLSNLCLCPYCHKNIIEISNLLISKTQMEPYIEFSCSSCMNSHLTSSNFSSKTSLKDYLSFLDNSFKDGLFPFCFHHSSRSGLVYCSNCEKNMCTTSCYEYHQSFEKEHSLHFAHGVGEVQCEIHRSKNCSFYCYSCRVYFCEVCIEEQSHNGHQCASFNELWKIASGNIMAMHETKNYWSAQSRLIEEFVNEELKGIEYLIKDLVGFKKQMELKFKKIKKANSEFFRLYQNILQNFLLSKISPKMGLINNMNKMKFELNIMDKNSEQISNMKNTMKKAHLYINSYLHIMNSTIKKFFFFPVKYEEINKVNYTKFSIPPIQIEKDSPDANQMITGNTSKPEVIEIHNKPKKHFQKKLPLHYNKIKEKKIKAVESNSTVFSSSPLIGHKIERSNSNDSINEICDNIKEEHSLSRNSFNNVNCLDKCPETFYANLNSNRNDDKQNLKRKKFKVNVIVSQEQKKKYSSCLHEVLIDKYTPLYVTYLLIENTPYIATSCENKTLMFYNLETLKIEKTIKTSPSTVLSFSQTVLDGNEIVVSLEDNTLKILNFITNALSITEYIGHTKKITDILTLSDRVHFLSSSIDKTIKLWRKDNEEYIYNFKGHTGSINAMILYDDNIFISAGMDGNIKGWGLNETKCIFDLKENDNGVLSLSKGPKDDKISANLIISISLDNTAKVWNIEELQCIGNYKEENLELLSVLWAEPMVIMLGGKNGDILFIEIEKFQCYQITEIAHSNGVKGLFLNSKNKTIISYGEDNIVKIWS